MTADWFDKPSDWLSRKSGMPFHPKYRIGDRVTLTLVDGSFDTRVITSEAPATSDDWYGKKPKHTPFDNELFLKSLTLPRADMRGYEHAPLSAPGRRVRRGSPLVPCFVCGTLFLFAVVMWLYYTPHL